jgi:hypothetical protein
MQPVSGAPPLTVALLDEQQTRRRSDCEPPPTVVVKQSGRLTDEEDKLFTAAPSWATIVTRFSLTAAFSVGCFSPLISPAPEEVG